MYKKIINFQIMFPCDSSILLIFGIRIRLASKLIEGEKLGSSHFLFLFLAQLPRSTFKEWFV